MVSLLCDLGVAARVIRGENILLVQEATGPHQGKWGFPKGRVDPGESPEAAALRELSEESGHEGTVLGLAGVRTANRTTAPLSMAPGGLFSSIHETTPRPASAAA